MRLEKMVFLGLCLVLSLGLVFANVGLCQGNKAAGDQKPAVSTESKEAQPAEKPKQPNTKSESTAPAATPSTPEKPAAPKKLPAKPEPAREGC
jgi:hypothetical protein